MDNCVNGVVPDTTSNVQPIKRPSTGSVSELHYISRKT